MVNNDLIKIKDVSDKYGITARTLRYYEDMGLIESTRSDDYAYRMYGEETIKRLEQILILRRLSISIKDIKRIFDTLGSEVVLEILGNKVQDIDEEIALLHELKEIVLEFIRQIKQADFSKDSDVKMLYERAKEIETQIVNADKAKEEAVDLNDLMNHLVEVSDKLEKSTGMRIFSDGRGVDVSGIVSLIVGTEQINNAIKQMKAFMQSCNPPTLEELKNIAAAFEAISVTCAESAAMTTDITARIQEQANVANKIHLAAEKRIQSIVDDSMVSV